MQRRAVISSLLSSIVLPGALALGSCAAPNAASPADDDAVAADVADEPTRAARATELLTGRFDSSAQAQQDTRYFAVQLRTCRIDVPALGAQVLYVEQAMMTALDQPYRQRVYAISDRDDGAVVSVVNELVQPERFVGFCDLSATDQAGIMPVADDIVPLPGCAVTLTATDDGFTGSTDGKACLNDHNGAVYATSEVTLTQAGIESWDRGYDASDAQVWGAVAGAYRFDRQQ